ncbi:MAG: hypothetical protein ACQEVA_09660 [Myxococcota bacterium]
MSQAIQHRWLVIALACLYTLSGCDLDPVPSDPTRGFDTGTQDDAASTTCIPGQTRCPGSLPLVEQCTDDGSEFVFQENCAAGTLCQEGACTPIATQCEESTDNNLPFTVSSTKLTFETTDDLKSTTASLELANCTESDIWLKRTEIRASSPSAGRAVFSINNPADFQGLRIPPGISETIRVKYEPVYAFSREPANLRLEVIGEELHEFDIPLEPRSYCVSATPHAETGLIQGAKRGSVFLHNCGTEPIELESISTVPDKDEPQPQATVTLDKTSGFETLESGGFLEVPYRIAGGRLGPFNHRIIYHLEDADKFTEERISTAVTGRVASVECRSEQLPPPRLEQGEESMRAWEFSALAGEEVGLAMHLPEAEDGLPLSGTTPIYRYRPPDGSRSEWEHATFPTLGKNTFTPDIPGTYRVDLNYIDATGRPLCEWKTARVHVRPDVPLYIDMKWKTHGDLIGHDTGYGRGADLNLHVLPASEVERRLPWGDRSGDCYRYGEYFWRDSDATEPAQSRCDIYDGQIRSASVSGAHRESVAFTAIERDRYYIAIHAWSLGGFQNAVADVRLYHEEQRVDAFELSDDIEDLSEIPISTEDLLQQRLRSNDEVWILGYWDATTNTLVGHPTRYSGFPN